MQELSCHTSNMRLACGQAPVIFSDPTSNAKYAIEKLAVLADTGVDLAVFPEAFLTGYCARSVEEAQSMAIGPNDGSIENIQAVCDRLGIHCIVGFAANASDQPDLPDGLSNAIAIMTPNEPRKYYAKTHLPFLGYDRFATPGSVIEPIATKFGSIGTLICYDMRPPEAARVLALKGADLIVLPTNWPIGAETSADHITIARAAENRVFFAACNRVGHENGFTFIGRSKIIDPTGNVLASAGSTEAVLVAELNFEIARQKRAVIIPDEYELAIMDCRQPSLYRQIALES